MPLPQVKLTPTATVSPENVAIAVGISLAVAGLLMAMAANAKNADLTVDFMGVLLVAHELTVIAPPKHRRNLFTWRHANPSPPKLTCRG